MSNLLYAEDNAINSKVMCALLGRHDHNCEVVENGALAVEAAKARMYDVILMDMNMPIMSGFDATQYIRLNEKAHNRRVPIVAVTALTNPGDKQRCFEAGVDDYLSKPFRTEEFMLILNTWLQRGSEGISGGKPVAESFTVSTELAFNYDALRNEYDGDISFIKNLLNEFLHTSYDDINQIKSDLDLGNYERLKHQTQNFYEAAQAVKAALLVRNLEQLIHSLQSADYDACRKFCMLVDEEFSHFVFSVEPVLNKPVL